MPLAACRGFAVSFNAYFCFTGAMGFTLRINQHGDSEGNYSLIARGVLKENPKEEYGMYPVGVFLLSENLTALPVCGWIVKVN